MDFEKKIERINQIISILENEEVPLEKNIELVEEGTKLANECKKYLESAELKITKITKNKEEKIEL